MLHIFELFKTARFILLPQRTSRVIKFFVKYVQEHGKIAPYAKLKAIVFHSLLHFILFNVVIPF